MPAQEIEQAIEEDQDVEELSGSKTIILFSDGTGNQSGKLNKTNVWRMYQAVDLGVPQQRNHPIQIGRYDNGVGTSAFRLLAMIQGIFGWGLKRNILSLYLFLCRNYRKGDRICLFGFSRGAFTVRVLADLIDRQGIIPHDRAGALDYLVRDAYRAYRRKQRPRMWPMRWLVPLIKWLLAGLRTLWRTIRFRIRYDQAENQAADIAFLGVWDTVGAYGGPVVEMVRAVDDWIMPISFTDKRLPRCVKAARHALALDDERDSFQPLPWNEANETRKRLQQVWFAGMHSDVGGGYPDDSLAYVSLVWMMDEAKDRARIRFRADREREARLQADSFGPIHDSRAGLGGYYRYQPRKISALMWPAAKGSESLVDPEQPEGQGMRRPALIHDSVFRRILSGTDGYAPIPISRDYEIVEDLSANPALGLPAEHRTRLLDRHWQRLHDAVQESVWDGVWTRRIVYFLIVLASIALIASPLLIKWFDCSASGVVADLVRLPLHWLSGLGLPVLDWWLSAFILCPWVPIALTIVIIVLFKIGGMLEKKLRAGCRNHWFAPPKKQDAKPAPRSVITRLRTHWVYQDILGFLRWQLMPSIFGIVLLAGLLVLFLYGLTVARLTWSEYDDVFCPDPLPAAVSGASFRITTDNPCNLSPLTVRAGQRYDIVLVVPQGGDWRDGSVAATPLGIEPGRLMDRGMDRFFLGMRRNHEANWMQPLAYVVSSAGLNSPTGTAPIRLSRAPDDPALPGAQIFRGTFPAPAHGRLAIAVNEAVPPWPVANDFFYRGRLRQRGDTWAPLNSGTACVSIAHESKIPPPPPACAGDLPPAQGSRAAP